MAKIALSTLAEDFAAIGLIPAVKAKTQVEASKCDDDDMDDDDDDDDDDEDEDEDEDDDDMDEAVKRVRTKKGTSAQRAKWRKTARKGVTKAKRRKHMKKSSTKRLAKKRAIKRRGRTGSGRVRLVVTGMDRVTNLLDDVQKLLGESREDGTEGLSESARKGIAKAYAQLALTADLLATKFRMVEDEDIEDLLPEIIEDLEEMAEDYGAAAVSLNDGSLSESEENLAEAFEADLADLLDALEVYDVSGKD